MKNTIKQRFLKFLAGYLTIFVVMGTGIVSAQTKAVTLIGEVNDTYQLVADGEIYDIADTPAGHDLARNYISQKVKVTGMVQDGSELKIITVITFEVVDE